MTVENFNKAQDYAKIIRTCSNTIRFTDHQFAPCNASIGSKNFINESNFLSRGSELIKWERAKDLFKDKKAHFVLDEEKIAVDPKKINKFNYSEYFRITDLEQGHLGNCWFVGSIGCLIQNYSGLKQVVPLDNTFEDSKYTGAFHFRFWIYGTWKDVVIDDYLPINTKRQLLFLHNEETPNEFWCALLEKAYAKICGSYEALQGGNESEGLTEMSGGIHQVFDLKTVNNLEFWNILSDATQRKCVAACSLFSKDRKHLGLISYHSYVITGIESIKISKENEFVKLVRLYNVWGQGTDGTTAEWNKKWSDNCKSWNLVEKKIKTKLQFKIEQDGEFWMNYDDWIKNFEKCEICNLTPTIANVSHNELSKKNICSVWDEKIFYGKWISVESNEDDSVTLEFSFHVQQYSGTCSVLIGLLQKCEKRRNFDSIAFKLFRIKGTKINSNAKRIKSRYLELVDSFGNCKSKFEVTKMFNLDKGEYVVIPKRIGQMNKEFILRVYTESSLNKKENFKRKLDSLNLIEAEKLKKKKMQSPTKTSLNPKMHPRQSSPENLYRQQFTQSSNRGFINMQQQEPKYLCSIL